MTGDRACWFPHELVGVIVSLWQWRELESDPPCLVQSPRLPKVRLGASVALIVCYVDARHVLRLSHVHNLISDQRLTGGFVSVRIFSHCRSVVNIKKKDMTNGAAAEGPSSRSTSARRGNILSFFVCQLQVSIYTCTVG